MYIHLFDVFCSLKSIVDFGRLIDLSLDSFDLTLGIHVKAPIC